MKEAISKAATLLEALPYIQRFRGQVFVVKYGGSFMDSDNLEVRHRVARDVVFLEAVGINPVVVHGGGKAITRALEIAGVKAQFVQGHRVTSAAAAEIVDRVLSREINPEIVKAIEEFGGKARGFAGPDVFRCRKFLPPNENAAGPASGGQPLQKKGHAGSRQTDGRSSPRRANETTGCPPGASQVDLGFVGEVVEVNTEPLRECIRRNVTPVISPTARSDDGRIYNCNADVAAAKAAIALKARRLVFMSDVPGLLSNPKDDATLMRHLCVAEVPALKQHGVIGEGMLPKVDSAVAAIESGVEKVQFVDGRIPHSVLLEIFTDAGVGTEVVR